MDNLRSELLNSYSNNLSNFNNENNPAELQIDKSQIQNLLDSFKNLNRYEQLYFLLQIGNCNRPSTIDLTKTTRWLRCNFVEDSAVAIPKEDVYSLYLSYASNNNLKPVSTADFGKIVRQVFPEVKARRLGQRGNSKYCYANIRRKLIPDEPVLPTIDAIEQEKDMENKIVSWGSKIFGIPLANLYDFTVVMNTVGIFSAGTNLTSRIISTNTNVGSGNKQNPSPSTALPSTATILQRFVKREDSIDDPELTTYLSNPNGDDESPSLRSLLTSKTFVPVKRRHASAFPCSSTSAYLTFIERSQSVPIGTDDYYGSSGFCSSSHSSTPNSANGGSSGHGCIVPESNSNTCGRSNNPLLSSTVASDNENLLTGTGVEDEDLFNLDLLVEDHGNEDEQQQNNFDY